MSSAIAKEIIPKWNLDDLYTGPKAPEISKDLKGAEASAKSFSAQYKGKADITDVWYGASFEDFGQNYSNLPLLSIDEVFQITRNYCSFYNIDETEILFERFTNRLINLISQPFYLQLFLQSYKSKKNKEFHTRLDLIQHYAKEYMVLLD